MAQSPAHKFGQILGDVFEASVEPVLRDFARGHSLYLDKKGPRPARTGKKVTWTDRYGNAHDLDFVLERGGTPSRIGTPVAFIETAWRRYTKHSRNKAQEIQGALLPLIETYRNAAPFMGAILAGVFTNGALTQMKSLGFSVLYFPYETVIEAFGHVDIDAFFDEQTPDAEVARKVRAWEALPKRKRNAVTMGLIEIERAEVQEFIGALGRAAVRRIELIRVLPLHGTPSELSSIDDAISFIQSYEDQRTLGPAVRYEIQIRYSNDDRIEAQFGDKPRAIEFLHTFQASAGTRLRPKSARQA
jgi:hypothetical protein